MYPAARSTGCARGCGRGASCRIPAILASGRRVDEADLPDEIRADASNGHASAHARGARIRTLDEVEREAILAALDAVGGNRAKAAAALGIGPATLFRKLKSYGDARA